MYNELSQGHCKKQNGRIHQCTEGQQQMKCDYKVLIKKTNGVQHAFTNQVQGHPGSKVSNLRDPLKCSSFHDVFKVHLSTTEFAVVTTTEEIWAKLKTAGFLKTTEEVCSTTHHHL